MLRFSSLLVLVLASQSWAATVVIAPNGEVTVTPTQREAPLTESQDAKNSLTNWIQNWYDRERGKKLEVEKEKACAATPTCDNLRWGRR